MTTTTPGLGLKQYHGGGDFRPRIEYDAKLGKLSVIHRLEPTPGVYVNHGQDITNTASEFVFDIGSIEIGWVAFPRGAAPDTSMVPFGADMPPRPSARHKAGFKIRVWDGREKEARDFMSNAGTTVDVIEALWDHIATTAEAVRGDVPIVRFAGVRPVTKGANTNFAPVLELVKWLRRDEAIFGPRTVAPPGTLFNQVRVEPPILAPDRAPGAANGQAYTPAAFVPAPPPVAPRAW